MALRSDAALLEVREWKAAAGAGIAWTEREAVHIDTIRITQNYAGSIFSLVLNAGYLMVGDTLSRYSHSGLRTYRQMYSEIMPGGDYYYGIKILFCCCINHAI